MGELGENGPARVAGPVRGSRPHPDWSLSLERTSITEDRPRHGPLGRGRRTDRMNTERPTPDFPSTPDDPNSPDPPAAAAALRDLTDAIPGAVYQYRLAPDGTERFLFLSRGAADLIEVPFEEI